MLQSQPIRLGTRGSPLALAQAHEVRDRLCEACGFSHEDVEVRVISTSGDEILDKALRDVGGKGLFTKEIEEALLAGEIDAAVHSMKDMETELPPGLMIGAILPREDVRDAFISLKANSLNELPKGAIVGTSSMRRQAQVKHLRSDLDVVEFRGNVQTRLGKLESGVADATILACAGLNRLGLRDKITKIIEPDTMLPAVAQGAIGIEIRQADEAVRAALTPLNHEETAFSVGVERAFLAALGGSCRTPIAGLAEIIAKGTQGDGEVRFRGMVLSPEGDEVHEIEWKGLKAEAVNKVQEAALKLRENSNLAFFET